MKCNSSKRGRLPETYVSIDPNRYNQQMGWDYLGGGDYMLNWFILLSEMYV